MFAMCVRLLSRYFHTVTHYSVLAIQNQPLFSFFLQKCFFSFFRPQSFDNYRHRQPSVHTINSLFSTAHSVKTKIFTQHPSLCDYYNQRKSGNSVEGCRICLCKSENGYPQLPGHVDNPCGQSCGQCGKLRVINRYSGCLQLMHTRPSCCIFLCIFFVLSFHQPRYVTILCHLFCVKKKDKSWKWQKLCCQKPSQIILVRKIFV